MRVFALLAVQVVTASVVLAGYNNPRYVPGAFIVKFKDSSSVAAASSAADRPASVNDSVHIAFESFLAERKIPYSTRFKFTDSSTFHGHSIMLSNPDDVQALKGFANVDAIYPVRRHQLHSEHPKLADRRGETILAPPLTKDDYSAHVMTGINTLHAQGLFGNGIKIGIIDSGIDYTHDALNGNLGYGQPCFGPDCPVYGGVALVQDDGSHNITGDPRPRCSPEDDYGHGTHTGGTIIAAPRDRDAPGVAPQAQLYACRIFDCQSHGAPSDLVMAALEQTYKGGVDLITMSLGTGAVWEDGVPETAVANAIVEKGVPVLATAGNAAMLGLWYSFSPGSSRNVLGVGAVTNMVASGFTATVSSAASGESRTVTYLTGNQFAFNETTKFKLYATSKAANFSADACDELPDSTPDLSDKVVLIGRGGCGADDKARNVAKKGGKFLIIYDRDDFSLDTSDPGIWPSPRSAGLPYADAMALLDMLSKGDVTIDFAGSKANTFKDLVMGGKSTYFTGYAITLDLHMGVSISSVGSFIESTWPDQSPSYVSLQGTSMSCPQVAGVVALYRQIKGKQESALDVRSVITTTGTPVLHYTGVVDTVARHGGGLVNAVKAVSTPIRLHPDRLELNDTAHLQDSWTVTLSNKGDKEQHFTVGHLPAGTVYTFEEGTQNVIVTDRILPVNQDQAQLSFEPASFSLPAGGEQKVNVKVQPPAAVQSRVPVYSGYVQFKSDDEMASVHVPYIGVAAEMSKIPAFNATSEVIGDVLPALITAKRTAIKDDTHVFSLADDDNKPTIMWKIVLGSKLVRVDLVKPDTAFVPTNAGTTTIHVPPAQRRSNRWARAPSSLLPASDIVASVYNMTFDFRDEDSISSDSFTLDATFVDDQGHNQTVPDGTFRLALRALKLFKTRDEEHAWESYLSPAFTIKKA